MEEGTNIVSRFILGCQPPKPLRIQKESYSRGKLTKRDLRVNKLTHKHLFIMSHLLILCFAQCSLHRSFGCPLDDLTPCFPLDVPLSPKVYSLHTQTGTISNSIGHTKHAFHRAIVSNKLDKADACQLTTVPEGAGLCSWAI